MLVRRSDHRIFNHTGSPLNWKAFHVFRSRQISIWCTAFSTLQNNSLDFSNLFLPMFICLVINFNQAFLPFNNIWRIHILIRPSLAYRCQIFGFTYLLNLICNLLSLVHFISYFLLFSFFFSEFFILLNLLLHFLYFGFCFELVLVERISLGAHENQREANGSMEPLTVGGLLATLVVVRVLVVVWLLLVVWVLELTHDL